MAQVALPAGAQLPGPGETLPTSSAWGTASATSPDGRTTVVPGSRGATTATARVHVAVRNVSGQWADVTVDDGRAVGHPPAYPNTNNNLHVSGLAAGGEGFVIGGTQSFWDAGQYSATLESVIWHSRDGRGWTRAELRTVVGTSNSFELRDLSATPSGFVAVGSISNLNATRTAQVAVLTSPDGTHWKLAATIKSHWALDPYAVMTLGPRLVIEGVEYACDTHAFAQATFSLGGQMRFWDSLDGGAHWTAHDALASGVITQPEPAPASIKKCPGSLSAIQSRFATRGTFAGVSGNTLGVLSADGTKVAITNDLTHWVGADLPDAMPADQDPAAITGSVATLTGTGSPLTLLSIRPRRNDANQEQGVGSQVMSWTTSDGGTAWTHLPSAKPVLVGPSSQLAPQPDGSVLLVASQAFDDPSRPSGRVRIVRSTPGNLVPWGSCTPGPGADFSFSTISGLTANTDLTGIDLSGAQVSSSDLSGDKLTGADLNGATFGSDTRFTGANLAGVPARGATIVADLTGADLTGADLTGADLLGATLDPSAFLARIDPRTRLLRAQVMFPRDGSSRALAGYDFGTLDLTGVSFGWPSGAMGDLTGADFRHATLYGASFMNVDLTGAHFKPRSGQYTNSISFYKGLCPDGKAAATGASMFAECRIGPSGT